LGLLAHGSITQTPDALQYFKNHVDALDGRETSLDKDLSPRYQPDGMLSSQKADREIAKVMETGSNLFEWTHQRINGENFYASVLVTSVTIEGRLILQGTIRNITDFKQSQEMMVQSEKMMSVGGLAAGMAHEINNPLGIILQTVQNVSRILSGTWAAFTVPVIIIACSSSVII